MSLLNLWKASPFQIKEKQVQQVISFAGEGQIKDGSKASLEFRELLSNVPSEQIKKYSEECLISKFDGSGFALQDVVNEMGRRLGFSVTNGRYRGSKNDIGFDGLWESPEGNQIVAEVKTSDAYRIDLNIIAGYRKALLRKSDINEEGISILIIVGRQDTGDLEAQIRGSKHAWDIRLISVDALLRLLAIKEEVEDPTIEARIRAILVPREYTRVDEIIDLVFSTKEDIKEDEPTTEYNGSTTDIKKTKTAAVNFNDACAARIEAELGQPLLKRSRALFSSADNKIAVLCAVSKEYDSGTNPNYWFAFHPHQQERLKGSETPYVAFGCGSPERIFLIPYSHFEPSTKRYEPNSSGRWKILLSRSNL